MVARTYTVAFEGVEARIVEVQCAVSAGMPAFSVVGLPDKAVSEARDRVRAALTALSIALPSKRITINLSPADLPKEGSHYDLPIALALLAAMGVTDAELLAASKRGGELRAIAQVAPQRDPPDLWLIFAPITSSTLVEIEEAARIALRDWERRIRVQSVSAVPDPDVNSKVVLTITYEIPQTNARGNLVFPFYLQGG